MNFSSLGLVREYIVHGAAENNHFEEQNERILRNIKAGRKRSDADNDNGTRDFLVLLAFPQHQALFRLNLIYHGC